jgi:hypothetical protein
MSFSGSTMGKYTRFWLILTGVILLGTGAVMAFALGSIPFAGGAMLGTGGILALVGIVLIVIGLIVGRRAGQTDAILQTGIAGTATVTGVTQTGMYLNEQPQLRLNLLVSLPGQVPYATTHTSFVPLMLMGRVTSGAPLSVRVDPADLNKVVVDWQSSGFSSAPMMAGVPGMAGTPGMAAAPSTMAAAPSAMSAPQAGGSQMDESMSQVQAAFSQAGYAQAAPVFASPDQANYTVEQLRAWLRQNGVEAQARVDFLEDSGKIVGDERLYTMEMTLNPMSGAPQKLPRSAAMVPLSASHKLFQGMSVPVRYAADNPNLLMVEWDRL